MFLETGYNYLLSETAVLDLRVPVKHYEYTGQTLNTIKTLTALNEIHLPL